MKGIRILQFMPTYFVNFCFKYMNLANFGFKIIQGMHAAHFIRDYLIEMNVWSLLHSFHNSKFNFIKYFWMKFKEAMHQLHFEFVNMQKNYNKLIAAIKQIQNVIIEIEVIGLYNFFC